MAVNYCTIEMLDAELVARCKTVAAFGDHGYSVFSADDLDQKRGRDALPVVGCAYDGAEPAPRDQNPNQKLNSRATLAQMQWTVIIAIQYQHNGESGVTREAAHALLDGLRIAISGFSGVNSRPWVWAGEGPLHDVSGDGVVYYGQVWHTTVVSVGESINQ